MRLANPTDAVVGLLVTAVGAGGLLLSGELPIGNAMRMGPGYFPRLLAWILIGFGLAIGTRAAFVHGPALAAWPKRPLLPLLAAVLVFAIGIEALGLFVSILAMVSIAGLAARDLRPVPLLAEALAPVETQQEAA